MPVDGRAQPNGNNPPRASAAPASGTASARQPAAANSTTAKAGRVRFTPGLTPLTPMRYGRSERAGAVRRAQTGRAVVAGARGAQVRAAARAAGSGGHVEQRRGVRVRV